jgi:hypothetical protein
MVVSVGRRSVRSHLLSGLDGRTGVAVTLHAAEWWLMREIRARSATAVSVTAAVRVRVNLNHSSLITHKILWNLQHPTMHYNLFCMNICSMLHLQSLQFLMCVKLAPLNQATDSKPSQTFFLQLICYNLLCSFQKLHTHGFSGNSYFLFGGPTSPQPSNFKLATPNLHRHFAINLL